MNRTETSLLEAIAENLNAADFLEAQQIIDRVSQEVA